MAEDGWGLNARSRLRIRLLEWLYDFDQSDPGGIPNINDFEPDYSDRPAVELVARSLVSDGTAAHATQRLAGRPRIRITPEGVRHVEWWRAQRANVVERERNCEAAFIDWLYEQRSKGFDHLLSLNFLQDWRATFWAEPFTEDDVKRATLYLRERGFINGQAAWGHGVYRPSLTAAGVLYAREGSEPARVHGTTYNVNVGTNLGQMQAGDGTFQQAQHQGIDAATLSTVLQAMRDALSDLDDEDDRDDLELHIGALEVESSKQEPDPEAIKLRVRRLRKIAATVGNPALTTAVAVATTQLLQALGLG